LKEQVFQKKNLGILTLSDDGENSASYFVLFFSKKVH